MKKWMFTLAICCFAFGGFAQTDYDQAIGLKFPGGLAATYKKMLKNNKAWEAQAMFWDKGARFVALYEFHFYNLDAAGRLAWYVGPGAHIGFYKNKFQESYNSSADIGIDGVIGVDYKIKNIPINLSLDWQPSISLIGKSNTSPALGGLAVRYTF
jgi:hypothetical protein